jgi:hypothetical protein
MVRWLDVIGICFLCTSLSKKKRIIQIPLDIYACPSCRLTYLKQNWDVSYAVIALLFLTALFKLSAGRVQNWVIRFLPLLHFLPLHTAAI